MDLKGTVALVTGGNGGLGQRICHALAKEGVHIAVMYAQSRDQAEDVAIELKSKYQIAAAAFQCDITDTAAVARGDVPFSVETRLTVIFSVSGVVSVMASSFRTASISYRVRGSIIGMDSASSSFVISASHFTIDIRELCTGTTFRSASAICLLFGTLVFGPTPYSMA